MTPDGSRDVRAYRRGGSIQFTYGCTSDSGGPDNRPVLRDRGLPWMSDVASA